MTLPEKIKYINTDFTHQPLYLMANEIPQKDEEVTAFYQRLINEQERYIRRFIGKGYEIEQLTKALSAAWVEGIHEDCEARFGK